MNCPDLAGKVVVITGAGTGLGRAMADQFAMQGSKLVGIGRTIGPLEEAMAEIVASGGDAIALEADVSDETQVETAVTAALAHYGQIDVLVNNAGFGPTPRTRVVDTEVTEWNRVVATNLTGSMLCSKHVARHFIERQAGVIVNVSSLAAKLPRLNMGSYSASKAGLEHLTRVLALELGKDGVRVNAVSPGSTRTDHLAARLDLQGASFDDRVSGNLEVFRSPILLGRVGVPEEQALPVVFLASDAASFITGQVIYVDGGAGII